MIGLAPVCAGLRGSAEVLRGASSATVGSGWVSDATGRASANGFWVNSVARGDISASSIVSSEEDCAVRSGSEAVI